MAKSLVSLNFAIADFPHTRAVRSGRIPIEGVAPNFVKVEPQIAAYRRMVRNVEFDVCELAPTTYIMARALGAPFPDVLFCPTGGISRATAPDSFPGPIAGESSSRAPTADLTCRAC